MSANKHASRLHPASRHARRLGLFFNAMAHELCICRGTFSLSRHTTSASCNTCTGSLATVLVEHMREIRRGSMHVPGQGRAHMCAIAPRRKKEKGTRYLSGSLSAA